jgi:hypothetical protein
VEIPDKRYGKRETIDLMPMNGYYAADKDVPEKMVAYNEDYVCNLFEKYNLQILKPIHYGSWCGRNKYISYQDMFIGKK